MLKNLFTAIMGQFSKICAAIIHLESDTTETAKAADVLVIVQGTETAVESVVPVPAFISGIINSTWFLNWAIGLCLGVWGGMKAEPTPTSIAATPADETDATSPVVTPAGTIIQTPAEPVDGIATGTPAGTL